MKIVIKGLDSNTFETDTELTNSEPIELTVEGMYHIPRRGDLISYKSASGKIYNRVKVIEIYHDLTNNMVVVSTDISEY